MLVAIQTDGTVQTLYEDNMADACRELGRLEVKRLSNIEFDNDTQTWGVSIENNLLVMSGFRTRADALTWEQEYFEHTLEKGNEMWRFES